MSDDVEIISDGDGIAIIGEQSAVDHFVERIGVQTRAMDLGRLAPALSRGSSLAQASSDIAANSGRWMKLTEESFQKVKAGAKLLQSKDGSSQVATVMGSGGSKFKDVLRFTKSGAGTMLTNPAVLAGAAGIMAQMAMQQTMEQITEYLETIDEKCDDILRAQKDAVLADVIGVGLVLDEAIIVRGEVGRVSDVTWSKVQDSSGTILRTQGYALRQLETIAEKLEKERNVDKLADIAADAAPKVQEWLVVLARCFQLHDALSVLELDRVLDDSPEDVDDHRRGIQKSRDKRLKSINESTRELVGRINDAATLANGKVLFNPITGPRVSRYGAQSVEAVQQFRVNLGVEGELAPIGARRWADAFEDVREQVFESSSDAFDDAKRVSRRSVAGLMSAVGKFASMAAERLGKEEVSADSEDVDGDTPRA